MLETGYNPCFELGDEIHSRVHNEPIDAEGYKGEHTYVYVDQQTGAVMIMIRFNRGDEEPGQFLFKFPRTAHEKAAALARVDEILTA
jgi:hypothetical protein